MHKFLSDDFFSVIPLYQIILCVSTSNGVMGVSDFFFFIFSKIIFVYDFNTILENLYQGNC